MWLWSYWEVVEWGGLVRFGMRLEWDGLVRKEEK